MEFEFGETRESEGFFDRNPKFMAAFERLMHLAKVCFGRERKWIPPMNENVLKNYTREDCGAGSPFGIGSEDYAKCSWGLLLPDLVPDALGNGYWRDERFCHGPRHLEIQQSARQRRQQHSEKVFRIEDGFGSCCRWRCPCCVLGSWACGLRHVRG